MKKQLFNLMMSLSIMLSCTFCTYDSFAEEAIEVSINGEDVVMDVAPAIINGRTLVPLRAIFEGLGAEVTWDSKTKTAIGETDEYIIKTKLYNKEIIKTTKATGKTETIALDVASTALNGRTLVPTRAIAETLDKKVYWDKYERAVVIVDTKAIEEEFESEMSNLMEIAHLDFLQNGKQNAEMNVVLEPTTENLIFSLNLKADGESEEYSAKGKTTIDINIPKEFLDLTLNEYKDDENNEQIMNIFYKINDNDITIEYYYDLDCIYINSNIFKLIPELEDSLDDLIKELDLDFSKGNLEDGIVINISDLESITGEKIDFKEMIDENRNLEKVLEEFDLDKMFGEVENVYYDDMKSLKNSKDIFIELFNNDSIKKSADDTGIVTYSFVLDESKVNDVINLLGENLKNNYQLLDDSLIAAELNKYKDMFEKVTFTLKVKDNVIQSSDFEYSLKISDSSASVNFDGKTSYIKEDVNIVKPIIRNAFNYVKFAEAVAKKQQEEMDKMMEEVGNTSWANMTKY